MHLCYVSGINRVDSRTERVGQAVVVDQERDPAGRLAFELGESKAMVVADFLAFPVVAPGAMFDEP